MLLKKRETRKRETEKRNLLWSGAIIILQWVRFSKKNNDWRRDVSRSYIRMQKTRLLYILCTFLCPLYSGCVFCVLCPVSRYHPSVTSEKFVISISFKMTDSQIIYYFHPWKKFIIWDDMCKTRLQQIAYTTYKCTQQIYCVRQVSGSRIKFCTPA